MTQLSFIDDYDDFGQPRQQTAIALPRRSAQRSDANETRILATYNWTTYTESST